MAELEAPSLEPAPGTKYPVQVEYCPKCSMPFEYCEYYPGYEDCKRWLSDNMPDKFAKMGLTVEEAGGGGGGGEDGAEGAEGGKKRQTRGGKGQVKAKKKDKEVEKRVAIFIAPRGKRKAVTVVQGLRTFGG